MTSTLAECTGSVCILSSTIHNIWCDNYIQVDCHAEIRYLRQNYSSLRSKVQALLFVALQAWQRQFCFEWMHQSNASQERVTATSGIWKGAKQAAMSYKTSSNALQNKRRFHHRRRRHCRGTGKQATRILFALVAQQRFIILAPSARSGNGSRKGTKELCCSSIVFWFLMKMRSSCKL